MRCAQATLRATRTHLMRRQPLLPRFVHRASPRTSTTPSTASRMSSALCQRADSASRTPCSTVDSRAVSITVQGRSVTRIPWTVITRPGGTRATWWCTPASVRDDARPIRVRWTVVKSGSRASGAWMTAAVRWLANAPSFTRSRAARASIRCRTASSVGKMRFGVAASPESDPLAGTREYLDLAIVVSDAYGLGRGEEPVLSRGNAGAARGQGMSHMVAIGPPTPWPWSTNRV